MLGNLLVALVLISGEFDFQASAIVESRAGEAPLLGGQEPQAFVTEIVTPVGMFEYRDPGVTFQADYSPRIYWQHPNALHNWSPLVLHTANLLLTAKSTRRLTLTGAATGSIGNPDYVQLAQMFTGQIPPVMEIASVTGHLGARIALTRRFALELGGQVFYWQSLGSGAAATTTDTRVTDQKSATESASTFYQLTPRHALGLGALLSQASYNGGRLHIYTIGPALTWRAHLTPRDDLSVTLGLTYVRASGTAIGSTMPLLGSSGQAASPVGAFDLGLEGGEVGRVFHPGQRRRWRRLLRRPGPRDGRATRAGQRWPHGADGARLDSHAAGRLFDRPSVDRLCHPGSGHAAHHGGAARLPGRDGVFAFAFCPSPREHRRLRRDRRSMGRSRAGLGDARLRVSPAAALGFRAAGLDQPPGRASGPQSASLALPPSIPARTRCCSSCGRRWSAR